MTRTHLLALSLLFATGCPINVGGGGGGDDDDSAAQQIEGDDPGECEDGADNDADGLFDCDDPDCAGAPVCQGDDDDATGDDDDATGDDDDSAVGDDDDSAGGCLVGEIEDCDGTCVDSTWLGDGLCDDGSYFYNGVPVYFNCAAYSWDNGDCPVPCTSHTTCGSTEFCHPTQGVCTEVFGQSWNLEAVYASAPQNDANGDTWDPFGGLPDMYARATVDGVTVLQSTTVQDSLSAYWGYDADFVLTNTSFCFSVFDDDAASDDLMDGTCWNTTAGIVGRARTGTFQDYLFNGIVYAEFTLTPNF